jgi:multiple sugar transport system permease protein
VLGCMLVVVPAALLVAQALNTRGLRVRDLWRTAYFLPTVVSPIVIALVFGLLFDQRFGLVNSAAHALFGTGGVDWLGDPTLAKVTIRLLMLWRWTGYLAVFFLARTYRASCMRRPRSTGRGGCAALPRSPCPRSARSPPSSR